jgi:hypothetical protein
MRIRQGNLFFLFGIAHCLLMVFASLYSLRMFPQLSIGVQQWNHWHFTFFLSVYVASAAAIVGQSLKTDVFVPQAILDALVGVVLFQLMFWAMRRLLARWDAVPWLSLLPGLFLVYYGFKLRRGRALWKRLELD